MIRATQHSDLRHEMSWHDGDSHLCHGMALSKPMLPSAPQISARCHGLASSRTSDQKLRATLSPERRHRCSTPAGSNSFAQEGLHIGHRKHPTLQGCLFWKQGKGITRLNVKANVAISSTNQCVLPWPGVFPYFRPKTPGDTVTGETSQV